MTKQTLLQLSKKAALWTISSVLLCSMSWLYAGAVASKQPVHFSQILEKAMPAVVHISVRAKINRELIQLAQTEGQRKNLLHKAQSLGSGVILDAEKGLIVTNAHVTKDAEDITVTLSDGRHFHGRLIGSDQASDVAVIKIHGTQLTAMAVGDSDDLQVGDFVAAIGSPYGLSQTVTSGIVSALQRTNLGIEGYENFIQTDAAINFGNSGGALINAKGELIGINTAILSSANGRGGSIGIGFAIPINMAKSVMEQLVEFGKLRRGLLGLFVQDLSPQLAEVLGNSQQKGAVVTQVFANSPAAKAGVAVGDIIIELNGKQITKNSQVRNATGLLRVGSAVKLTVLRSGQRKQLQMRIADPKKYEEETAAQSPFLQGLVLETFAQLMPGRDIIHGVRVLLVEDGSPANQAMPNLLPGDVIIAANQQAVTNLEQLYQLASDGSAQLVLHVLRGNGALFIVMTPKIK